MILTKPYNAIATKVEMRSACALPLGRRRPGSEFKMTVNKYNGDQPEPTIRTELASLKDGDQTAWDRIVPQISPFLRVKIRRLGGSAQEDDLLQEVLLKASLDLGPCTFQSDAKVFAWFAEIARTQVLMSIRAENAVRRGGKERPKVSHSQMPGSVAGRRPSTLRGVTRPSQVAVSNELVVRIHQILDGFSERDRAIFADRREFHRPEKEVMDAYQVSRATVQRTVSKVHKALYKALKEKQS